MQRVKAYVNFAHYRGKVVVWHRNSSYPNSTLLKGIPTSGEGDIRSMDCASPGLFWKLDLLFKNDLIQDMLPTSEEKL